MGDDGDDSGEGTRVDVRQVFNVEREFKFLIGERVRNEDCSWGEGVSPWALKGQILVGCVRGIEIATAVGARRTARIVWMVWDCILANIFTSVLEDHACLYCVCNVLAARREG